MVEEAEEEQEEEILYKLTLIGCLPVHHLTTMAMLPWVVAEIIRSQAAHKELGARLRSGSPGKGRVLEPFSHSQTVFLSVSASWVRCVSVLGEGVVWNPLTHTVLFECRPHQLTKLIHNSQEPSSFGCLVRDSPKCACFVFQCKDSTKVGADGSKFFDKRINTSIDLYVKSQAEMEKIHFTATEYYFSLHRHIIFCGISFIT